MCTAAGGMLGIAFFGYCWAGTPNAARYLDLILIAVGVLDVVAAFARSRRPLLVISVEGVQLPAFLWWGAETIPWSMITGIYANRRWLTIAASNPDDTMWHRTLRLKARDRFGGDVPLSGPWFLPARAEVLAELGEEFHQAAMGHPAP